MHRIQAEQGMGRRGILGRPYRSHSSRYWACCAGLVCFFVGKTSIAFASSCAPQTTLQTTTFLLESGKAGPFEVGATVEEIYNLVGRDHVRLVNLFNEGIFTPALAIQAPGSNTEPTIVAHIREWPCAQFSVWGIEVQDRRFGTREGLGIGSTLGELRRHYKVKMMRGEGDEIAFAPTMNLSFALDAVDAPTDLSKVKSVWVPPQPQEVRNRRCPQLGSLR